MKKISMMKATNSSARISDGAGSVEEGEGPAKREMHVYEESKTYVFLEVELHSPLIAKRPISALAQRSANRFN